MYCVYDDGIWISSYRCKSSAEMHANRIVSRGNSCKVLKFHKTKMPLKVETVTGEPIESEGWKNV